MYRYICTYNVSFYDNIWLAWYNIRHGQFPIRFSKPECAYLLVYRIPAWLQYNGYIYIIDLW